MDAEGLKLKIDTKGAQQDLLGLEKSLNKVSVSADRLDAALSRTALSTSVNLTKATRAMEKYAQVAALLSKIRVAGNPVGQIRELGLALDTIGRARVMTEGKIASIRALGQALNTLRVPERLVGVAALINSLGVAKAPSQSAITRLKEMFIVLSTAKGVPNASHIALDLDTIAAAANRASRALRSMPPMARNFSAAAQRASPVGVVGGAAASTRSAAALGSELEKAGSKANKARASFSLLGNGLGGLSSRFRLSYQAGTLLSMLFASFTTARFFKSLYDINIQLLKLQKGLLFATGTFAGAEKATDAYIAISQKLGLSITENIETYGRFVIAATASGMKIRDTNKVYEALGTAMTVIGASAIQQGLAFYGLTEMMQKGVVYSKEFNRQIGAQLPGNAVIGAAALSKLQGHFVSVSEFFKQMHSGTLLAVDFVPEWAKQVDKMYHPLLALAQQRPDVALMRLKNTFVMFAREVGTGKFMSAIGNGLTSLMSKLVQGEGANAKLTASGQKLADSLGKTLVAAIHMFGTALGWVIDHVDLLLRVLKLVVIYKLASELFSWGASAFKAAASIGKLTTAILGLAKAEEKEAIASALTGRGKAAAIGVPAASSAAASVASAASAFGHRKPASSFQSMPVGFVPSSGPAFGRRAGLGASAADWERYSKLNGARAATTPLEAVSGTALRSSLGYGVAEGAGVGAGAAAAEAGVATAATGVAAALTGLGIVAVLTATALIAIRPAATGGVTAKGNPLIYSDIEDSAFKSVVDSLMGTLDSLAGGFADFGTSLLSLFDIVFDGGKVVAGLAAFLQAFGTALYVEVSIPIRAAWAAFKGVAELIYGVVNSIVQLFKNGWSGAKTALSNMGSDLSKTFWDFISGSHKDLSGANVGGNYNKIMAGAKASADARAIVEAANASDKQIEAAVQQQAAAKANMDAANLMKDTMEQYNDMNRKLDYAKDIAPRLQALADGSFFQSLQPHPVGTTPSGIPQLRGLSSGAQPSLGAIAPGGHAAKDMLTDEAGQIWAKAIGYLHTNETSGKEPLQQLFGLGNTSAANLDPEKVAWCAAFVNGVLGMQGVKGTGKLNASSFLNYGEGVKTPQRGDIVVLKPQSKGDTGHVGFYSGTEKNGNIDVLGGNQNNEVNVSPFRASDVLAYRHPTANLMTANDSAAGSVVQGTLADQNTETDATGGTKYGAASTKLASALLADKKQIEQIGAGGGPVAAALAKYQEDQLALLKVINSEEDKIKANKGFKGVISADDKKAMDAADLRHKQILQDTLDPFGKLVRLQQASVAITDLQLSGQDDLASYQEKYNADLESGYTVQQLVNDESKKAWLLGEQTIRQKQSQIDLQKELNDIDLKRMTRLSNNPVQNAIDAKVMAHGGKDYADKLAQSQADHTYDSYVTGAKASAAETDASARQSATESLNEMTANSVLNPTAKSLRDDYKQMLQEMTGLSTDSLDRLNATASADQKAFAQNYAATKAELENPPGFQKWVNGLEPIAKRLEDIKATFAEDLSSGITDALMGDKVDWSSMVKDLRKQWMKAQVDNVMSGAMNALGLTQTQTPEQAMGAASTTFQSSTVTFAQSVAAFASVVASGTGSPAAAAAAQSAGAVATAANANSLGLRGSIFDASASSTSGTGIGELMSAQNPVGGAGTSGTGIGELMSAQNPAGGTSGTGGGIIGSLTSALGLGSAGKSGTGGKIGNLLLDALGIFGGSLFPTKKAPPDYAMPNGIIGSMSQNTVSSTAVAGHANMIGSILNMVAQAGLSASGGTSSGGFLSNMFNGGGGQGTTSNSLLNLFGGGQSGSGIGELMSAINPAGGAAGSGGIMDFLKKIFGGMFAEGGYSTEPVSRRLVNARTFRDVAHYAEGTMNTSGIPAILHPNEAVVPLSRNRKIPVDMGDASHRQVNVSSNITVIAPNPDAFRKASGSITRDQNRTLKRAALRNLTGTL